MDGIPLDVLVRSVIQSRRSLLAGALASLTALQDAAGAGAKKGKKHRKQKTKARPNEFGCLEVGDPCKTEEQCCSGACTGKKGKRTCQAHDTGTCKQDGQLVPCNNRTTCGCFQTTAASDVCAELFVPGGSACAACQTDADCEALGFPSGSACGSSPITCESGAMACFVPCGEAPVES